MEKYVPYNKFRVVVKGENPKFHDRMCKKLIGIPFTGREYVSVECVGEAIPCRLCNNARFYFEHFKGEEYDRLLEKGRISVSYSKSGNVFLETGSLVWRVTYDPYTCCFKLYNGRSKASCTHFQYSCGCKVLKVLRYVSKFSKKKSVQLGYNREVAVSVVQV